MLKHRLELRNKREDIVTQIASLREHLLQFVIDTLVKTGQEIGFHLDIAVDDEIPHFAIGKLHCMRVHLTRLLLVS